MSYRVIVHRDFDTRAEAEHFASVVREEVSRPSVVMVEEAPAPYEIFFEVREGDTIRAIYFSVDEDGRKSVVDIAEAEYAPGIGRKLFSRLHADPTEKVKFQQYGLVKLANRAYSPQTIAAKICDAVASRRPA